MSLIGELEEEVKDAMRAHDNERRDALRLILSSLKSAEKELLRPLSDDEELQVLQRERKKRQRGGRGVSQRRPGGSRRAGGGRARGARGVHARAARRG